MMRYSQQLSILFAALLSIRTMSVSHAQTDDGRESAPLPLADAAILVPADALRPELPNIADSDVPPELREIVGLWEKKSKTIDSICGTFTRSEFNHTFKEEKMSRGRFFLERAGRWRIDGQSIQPKKGESSKRRDKEGRAYTKEPSEPYTMIFTGEEVFLTHSREKSYSLFKVPRGMHTTGKIGYPVPFLLFIDAEEARRSFQFTNFRHSEQSVIVVGTERDRSKNYRSFFRLNFLFDRIQPFDGWKKVAIDLNKQTSLPAELRLLDESGNEHLYVFDRIELDHMDALEEHPFDAAEVIRRDGLGEIVITGPATRKRFDLESKSPLRDQYYKKNNTEIDLEQFPPLY